MEKTTVLNAINALKSADKAELAIAQRTIRRAIKRGVSIEEAFKAEQFQPGEKVLATDKAGVQHQAVIQKVNSVRIRVMDKKTKEVFSVRPDKVEYAPAATAAKRTRASRQTSAASKQ